MHDKISELNKPVTVVREIPRKGQGAVQAYTANAAENSNIFGDNKNWVPIRIKAFTRDLNDPSKYCTVAGEERYDQTYTKLYCRANGVLTVRKKRIIEEQLIPEAIKMHTERIFVVRETGIVKVPSMEHTYCSHYTIPEEHHTIGLQDAELYFYVSALQTDRAMAWGAYCACTDDGRPIVGSLNLNPTYVEATDAAVRTVAHEIAHLLGFDYYMFLKLGIVDTGVTLRQRKVAVINTTQSKKVASEHYGCPNATGVELESTSSCGTARSHLEFRNAKDEMMAPSSKASYYTKLTLGIFESMPFYKVNYSMAEPMKWGNNSGCGFLEKKCL
ncbi:surface protease GP63, partial [Trypanosoma theileri]